MQSTCAYLPPMDVQGNAEPYRASLTASSISLPSLSLPPIHAIDGQGQPPATSPLPLPATPMGYYLPPRPPSQQRVNMAAAPRGIPPQNMAMRFQLPLQGLDKRIMSGGRHKKEIKRRTKTGCLTCRKRKIKCDEAHPTCRNCQKSKRECLGYDSTFKQQPGPAQIQPAPSAAASTTPDTAAPSPAPVAYSHIPQDYAPAAPNYPDHSTSPPRLAPNSLYELIPAIDPALAGADPAAQMAIPSVA